MHKYRITGRSGSVWLGVLITQYSWTRSRLKLGFHFKAKSLWPIWTSKCTIQTPNTSQGCDVQVQV